MVAVRGMVVIKRRIEFDVAALAQSPESIDVHFRRTTSQHQDIDQLLSHPGFDVDSIEMTAREILWNADRKQVGSTPALAHFKQHLADLADQIRKGVALDSLLTGTKQNRDAGEVEADAVEIVLLGNFFQDSYFVLSYRWK